MVEQEVDFDGAFAGAVFGPVEDFGTQVDDGAVQTVELARGQQRGFGVGGEFGAEIVQRGEEERVIDLTGAVPAAETVRVAVALAADGLFNQWLDDQMEKLAENAGYLRQGWGPRGRKSDRAGNISRPYQDAAFYGLKLIWTRVTMESINGLDKDLLQV